MIRQAVDQDYQEIVNLWKQAFKDDDNGSVDFYFDQLYHVHQSIVLEENGQIISSLQSREKKLSLFGKTILVNYIVGVVTREDQRGKGYMKKLLNAVLDEGKYRYLITVLQAYHPEIYEPFGFETIMNTDHYKITQSMMNQIDDYGVNELRDPLDMMICHQRFTEHFTGYFVREEQDFREIMAGVKAESGRIIGYLQNNQCLGYGIYYFRDGQTVLDEAIYDRSSTLKKLLSYGLRRHRQIELVLSPAEKLSRIFPKIRKETQPWMMARINQTGLFDDLYHVRIISAYSAFRAFNTPLWNRDYL